MFEIECIVNRLDRLFVFCGLATIVSVQDGALIRIRLFQSHVDHPGTLVVVDIGADLANDLGVAVAVQEIVLDLKVLAQRNQNTLCRLKVLAVGHAGHIHGERDREVERVEGGLVRDDELVLVERELVEVHMRFRRNQEVQLLAELGLERHLVHEIHDVDIVGLAAKVFAQKVVDGRLDHKRVIDGNVAHTLLPTG